MTAPRIVVGTPVQSRQVSVGHYESMLALYRDTSFQLLPASITVDDDVVRARSRLVKHFLNSTNGTHLLFVDSDIIADVRALRGMLAASVDCIGTTYPKKQIDAWGASRDFAIRTGQAKVVNDRASVDAIGAGFMLLRRELLLAMWEDCEVALHDDSEDEPLVMLFALSWETKPGPRGPRTVLLPEDYSFCARVRQFTDVWLYCGEGSPLAHEGHHVFRGHARNLHERPQPIQAPSAPLEADVCAAWARERPTLPDSR